MDPLSVAVSVVGLIAAGVRLIPQLYKLSSNIKDAPQQARAAVSELRRHHASFDTAAEVY
jgi:hypothetical protein